METPAAGSKREPHFFKIILPHILKDGTLEIPPAFVSKYGKLLKAHVFLTLPKGAVHKVELIRSNGRVWLQKGWPEFVNLCSIGCSYFLVFRYEPQSTFHLLIFDPKCSEIEYPNDDDDDSDDDNEVVEIPHECPNRTVQMGDALERANAFETQNPHFTVRMRQAYISKNYLHVPRGDARSCFYGREDKGVEFQGPDGRVWRLNFYLTDGSNVRIGSGWTEFVREYNLQVGDACVFELLLHLLSTTLRFKITIFRRAAAGHSGQ